MHFHRLSRVQKWLLDTGTKLITGGAAVKLWEILLSRITLVDTAQIRHQAIATNDLKAPKYLEQKLGAKKKKSAFILVQLLFHWSVFRKFYGDGGGGGM